MGKTSTQVKNRWNAEHYSRISVSIPKEDGEKFKEKCQEAGVTQAEILKEAIYKFLEDLK
jgi:predicted DNA-binding protein